MFCILFGFFNLKRWRSKILKRQLSLAPLFKTKYAIRDSNLKGYWVSQGWSTISNESVNWKFRPWHGTFFHLSLFIKDIAIAYLENTFLQISVDLKCFIIQCRYGLMNPKRTLNWLIWACSNIWTASALCFIWWKRSLTNIDWKGFSWELVIKRFSTWCSSTREFCHNFWFEIKKRALKQPVHWSWLASWKRKS